MARLYWETPEEINLNLAKRVVNLRKRKKISQLQLRIMSKGSYGSIKWFETTGLISLLYLTQIAVALDAIDEKRNLIKDVPYKNTEEILNEYK